MSAELDQHSSLEALAPGVRQQVATLLRLNEGSGMAVAPLPDPSTRSALPRPATRFALDFQYCLERVRWQVLMQRQGPTWVPDFIFSESTFQPLVPGLGSGINAAQLAEALDACEAAGSKGVEAGGDGVAAPGSGSHGGPVIGSAVDKLQRRSDQLARVVALLMNSYAAHHMERVTTMAATDSRLQFELDTTDADARQVMLQKTAGAAATKVVFVVPVLGVQLAPLLAPPQAGDQGPKSSSAGDRGPKSSSAGDRGPKSSTAGVSVGDGPLLDAATEKAAAATGARAAALAAQIRLKVTYTVGSTNSSSSYAAMASRGGATETPQLQLSLPLELTEALGKTPSLPGWAGGMCLMEFLPSATEALQEAVNAAAASRGKRYSLIKAISAMAGGPLQADTAHWWKATWRIEVQNFVCLLHLHMTASYPEQIPRLMLQADGADTDESRPTVTYSDYGWSPRWVPSEAARRIFSHLEDTAPQWRAHLAPPVGLTFQQSPPQPPAASAASSSTKSLPPSWQGLRTTSSGVRTNSGLRTDVALNPALNPAQRPGSAPPLANDDSAAGSPKKAPSGASTPKAAVRRPPAVLDLLM